MRWIAESLACVALALAVHLGLALRLEPPAGADAGGQDGAAMVTLAAASPSVASLVEDWDQPPEAMQSPAGMEPPAAETRAPVLPVAALEPPAMPRPGPPRPEAPVHVALPAVDAATPPPPAKAPEVATAIAPRAPPPPQAAAVVIAVAQPVRRPATEAPRAPGPAAAPPQPEPLPESAADSAAPARQDTQASPAVSRRPAQRPAGLTPPPAAAAPHPGSAASQAQTSAGSGGSEQAGTSGRSGVKALGQAQSARLVTLWGGQIRARIERQKHYPRSARGKGRVILRLTVTRDGRVAAAAVARTAGLAAFDQAALAAVARAGRLPAAPDGLDQPAYAFNLPIDFE